MSKKHVRAVKKHTLHDKKTSGCIIYCTSRYSESNPHSHRWHAAKQARAEKRVPYSHYNLSMPRAFRSRTRPFWHNCHHIIPSGEIEAAIDKTANLAGPNESVFRELIIGSLLKEPYNNNAQPNMIVLPMYESDSIILGLPTHLGSHPTYSKEVGIYAHAKFLRKYQVVARQVKIGTCGITYPNMPKLKSVLTSISKRVYESIIALAIDRLANPAKHPEVKLNETSRKLISLFVCAR